MTFSRLIAACAVGAAALGMATTANAAIDTIFDDIASGRTNFQNMVSSYGGTAQSTVLSGFGSGYSVDAGDFTITRNNGGVVGFTSYGTMSGDVIGINPFDSNGRQNPGGRDDPMDYFASGVTFTFDQAINAFALEVGDWATCCHSPTTDLFISFDGGAPILVASADNYFDGQFPSQNPAGGTRFEILVAAFDDTDTFSQISFWGNGIGEYLVAGGEIHYSDIEIGSIENGTDVPVPATFWLMVAGVGGIAALRRRKKAA